MNSLERRLVFGLGFTLLAVFLVLFWGSVIALRSVAESHMLTRLEHDAEALVAAFGPTPRGQVKLREGRIAPIYQQPLSGHYFVLAFDEQNRIRSRSLWDEDLPVEQLVPGQVRTRHLPGPGDQRLLVRMAGYEKSGRHFTLLVAEDMTPTARRIERLQWLGLGTLGIALLMVLLVQRTVLRRGFLKLDRVRSEIQQIAHGEQQQIEELGPSEVQPLAIEVNRLLNQQQQRLRRSRQAVGNLAHGLKAPLSLLTRDLETLSLTDEERQRLTGRLLRISTLIDRELRRARIAGEGAGQHFNPTRHIPELVEALDQLYREREIEIAVGTLPDVALPHDYEDMLELLGNLLDNACKWAAGRVELSVSVDHDVSFSVADDGAGVDGETRETLLRRGSRLDEQTQGHGLGLAIVRDLVDDYGGRLEFGSSASLGGLEVRIHLPIPGNT